MRNHLLRISYLFRFRRPRIVLCFVFIDEWAETPSTNQTGVYWHVYCVDRVIPRGLLDKRFFSRKSSRSLKSGLILTDCYGLCSFRKGTNPTSIIYVQYHFGLDKGWWVRNLRIRDTWYSFVLFCTLHSFDNRICLRGLYDFTLDHNNSTNGIYCNQFTLIFFMSSYIRVYLMHFKLKRCF